MDLRSTIRELAQGIGSSLGLRVEVGPDQVVLTVAKNCSISHYGHSLKRYREPGRAVLERSRPPSALDGNRAE